ncbi:MAG TPA: hypothetical protein P5256_12135 [Beijerinckiaceae bacterium]|nr:hypothetical protein [Beijerinckiaceae bacterium]
MRLSEAFTSSARDLGGPLASPPLQLQGSLYFRDNPPAWSPFTRSKMLAGPLALLFPVRVFQKLTRISASPTNMREFNAIWRRRYERSLIGDWAPAGPFQEDEIPHLFALAVDTGAFALLDFYQTLIATPKLFQKFVGGLLSARTVPYVPPGHSRRDVIFITFVIDATVGIFDGRPSFFEFLTFLRCADLTSTSLGQAAFSYIVDGIGEDALTNAARNFAADPSPLLANAGRAFLGQPLIDEGHALDQYLGRPLKPAPARPEQSEPALLPAAAAPSPHAFDVATPAPAPREPKWIAPATPDRVVLTKRAERELRATRGYSSERLEVAFQCLADYRAMKRGEITLAEYNERLARARFADHRCFADTGSLKAFASDYSVVHEGKKYMLDRHLKWGRGTNPTTAIRVYYTFDVEKDLIIIGSAPRHLPVWKSN